MRLSEFFAGFKKHPLPRHGDCNGGRVPGTANDDIWGISQKISGNARAKKIPVGLPAVFLLSSASTNGLHR